MNTKLRLLGEQTLIVFNIFILFLLLFDNKLVLPFWLQPLGRMHTLLLHFPIVLLILAIGMELFRFSSNNRSNIYYSNFTRSLLLAGTLLAGITVVMGFFLSREEGYAGDILQWHKWTGSAIFFIASFVYWLRNKQWYRVPAACLSAITIIAFLIITGHYGATLTHGENYILQPITATIQKPPVPLDQAIIFKDIIQPILEKKCTGCHNPHKLKGEMALTDTLSIMKGGKTGQLFVPGNTEISLLLRRVHLPLEEEKHMPPAGKPQLTADEITLLSLWIKEQAGFNQKVIALPAGDSLRLMATVLLQPAVDSAALFNFPPADEKTIAKLNTDYRTIAHLAKESPALDISIYNRDAYTIKQLKELDEIKKQVVSLNLTKLPVTDEDLKSVGQFENLRRLDLNFTEISDKGLDALTSLQYLHTLSLSGTKITYNGLNDKLPKFKNLSTIAVWNTGISSLEITRLQQAYKTITFIEGFKDSGAEPLKLNPPQVKNSTMVFASSLPVLLRHPIRGTEIRYTTDGSEPDSIHSPLFDNNTVISKNTTVKAKAYKTGWYTSETAVFDFFKNTFIPDSVELLLPLNSVHQAEGAHTFFNTRLGLIGANNPAWANYWAGVKNNDMVFISVFHQPVNLSCVGLHYMVEEATGIYPPASIEIWGGENEKQPKLLTTMKPSLPAKGDKPLLKIVEGSFKPRTISWLKIIARPHHTKKDKHLLLVDEMFLN